MASRQFNSDLSLRPKTFAKTKTKKVKLVDSVANSNWLDTRVFGTQGETSLS